MEKSKGLAIVLSSIILGSCIVWSAFQLAAAIDNAGTNISGSTSRHVNISGVNSSDNDVNENFELVVNDGWLYLYDKASGQVWKKIDDAEGLATWEAIIPFDY